MDNRRPLIAGNWKLNGTRHSVVELASDICSGEIPENVDVLLCPTAVHLSDVLAVVGNSAVRLGAQNCALHGSGAFTGEVAAEMLAEFGCEYVIAGHSERRSIFGEDSAQVAGKCVAVQQAGLTPILCVGETLDEREADQVESVIGEQLDALLSLGGVGSFAQLVVAYEPVWAIGTGKTASPEQAQAVHALIREKIAQQDAGIAASMRILYGGSVKPDNAATLFAQQDIDGGLIGGAALDADSFLAICTAAG
ncbi:MAG: triose-phosphate isomerase [Granulosicoccus sp.]